MGWAGFLLEALTAIFVVILGLVALIVVILFIIDRRQTSDAVRRNYPVLDRFRQIFSELGEFFRQDFFAMDREELPFNRAQCKWIVRASKGQSNTVALRVDPGHQRGGALLCFPTPPSRRLTGSMQKPRHWPLAPIARSPLWRGLSSTSRACPTALFHARLSNR